MKRLFLFLILCLLVSPAHAQDESGVVISPLNIFKSLSTTTQPATTAPTVVTPQASTAGLKSVGVQDLQKMLTANEGRVVIVSFWASWCSPCVKKIPILNALRQDYPEKSLNIIGISVDTDAQMVTDFMKTHKLNFPTYLDNGQISESFAIQTIPRIQIYSASGKKVIDHVGTMSANSFHYILDRLIKK